MIQDENSLIILSEISIACIFISPAMRWKCLHKIETQSHKVKIYYKQSKISVQSLFWNFKSHSMRYIAKINAKTKDFLKLVSKYNTFQLS